MFQETFILVIQNVIMNSMCGQGLTPVEHRLKMAIGIVTDVYD
jgi:hypothetical protein